MSRYTWICLITLNTIEYVGIHLKKQIADYASILNVSDAVHSRKTHYKLLSNYWDRHFQNTVKHLRCSVLQKDMGEGGCVEHGHFDKHFIKNTRNRSPQQSILEFFLQGTLRTTFWMENLTQRWTQSAGPFFPKSGYLFSIFQ